MKTSRGRHERDFLERMSEATNRKTFLKWTGGAFAVVAAGAACDDDTSTVGPSVGPGGASGTNGGPVVSLPLESDTDILKFALFLELLEEDFYVKALDSGVLDDRVLELTTNVQQHESAHVEFIQTALGSEAFTQDDVAFDFGSSLDNAANFLATAQVLEQTGVMAYLGALPMIETRANRTAAGSIYTVEARHTAAFRAFNRAMGGPVPKAFEEGATPEEIIQAVTDTGFVVEGLT